MIPSRPRAALTQHSPWSALIYAYISNRKTGEILPLLVAYHLSIKIPTYTTSVPSPSFLQIFILWCQRQILALPISGISHPSQRKRSAALRNVVTIPKSQASFLCAGLQGLGFAWQSAFPPMGKTPCPPVCSPHRPFYLHSWVHTFIFSMFGRPTQA